MSIALEGRPVSPTTVCLWGETSVVAGNTRTAGQEGSMHSDTGQLINCLAAEIHGYEGTVCHFFSQRSFDFLLSKVIWWGNPKKGNAKSVADNSNQWFCWILSTNIVWGFIVFLLLHLNWERGVLVETCTQCSLVLVFVWYVPCARNDLVIIKIQIKIVSAVLVGYYFAVNLSHFGWLALRACIWFLFISLHFLSL